MWRACFVDSRYSMTPAEADELVAAYARIGVEVAKEDLRTEDEIIAAAGDADALLCNGNPPITGKVLRALPRVKVVQRFGIGVNSVDLEAATACGVLVLNQPGISSQELSIHATGLILDLLRNISYYDRGIRRGEWRKAKGVPCPPMQELVLGLFGFGATSKLLCGIFLNGLGVKKVIAHDPYLRGEDMAGYGVESVSFDELLRQSDILSIHAPLNSQTHHCFDYEAFRRMKPGALLVNISRGGLVCEEDLIRALREGEIRGAGLDVFETEPLPAASPLTGMENVVLTCHSAFFGVNSRRQLPGRLTGQLREILTSNSIAGASVVNREVVSKIPGFAIL